jgi:radical SAM superfamily enzyme YgiQ (UPF0313 family)
MPRKVVKWCKQVGIEVHTNFVIGFPGETLEEIYDTTNYAYELDADSTKFSIATPFPSTELLQVAVEKKMFPANYDFYTQNYLGFANPTMDSEHWTTEQLKIIRVKEWDRINFCTEEKKKRYAKVNEFTLEELEDFRKQTRKNMGNYFADRVKDQRKEKTNKKISESKRWEMIRKTAAEQAAVSRTDGWDRSVY